MFCNVAVVTVNGVVAGVRIPAFFFADLIPLLLCALEGNARQARATVEHPIPDAHDVVADGNARQARATVERPIPDVRDTVRNGDAHQARAIAERTFD